MDGASRALAGSRCACGSSLQSISRLGLRPVTRRQDRDVLPPIAGASPKFRLPHPVRRCMARIAGGAITGMRPGDDFGATAHVNHDSGNLQECRITFAASADVR